MTASNGESDIGQHGKADNNQTIAMDPTGRKILLTGGTGLIGRQLCRTIARHGDAITVVSRRPGKAAALCGVPIDVLGSLDEISPVDHFDAVINLAGAPILGRRWSARRKRVLVDSRVALTTALVHKLAQTEAHPAVFINASAIGYYGDTGDAEITESGPAQHDFGAEMCRAWEQAAMQAEPLGIRTCVLRSGLVLSRDGGMFKQMQLPFRLGLGMRIGSGKQWMSWIHVHDEVAAILHLLNHPASRGAYNLTAPEPATNLEFTHSLAAALGRPCFLSMPAWAIQAMLGEAAGLLLGGQKVLPERLTAEGFTFRYHGLTAALEALIGN